LAASRYLGLYSLTSQYNSQPAATPSQLPNPNLTWESKYQTNIGIDVGFFKRISLSVDVYKNQTKNLLLQVSQPLSVGFETRWENAGEIENKGLEIALSTIQYPGQKLYMTTDFNISFNTNTLQKLPASFVKTGSWAISQIYRNGGNLYEFYMPVWLGVDPQTGAAFMGKSYKGCRRECNIKGSNIQLRRCYLAGSWFSLAEIPGRHDQYFYLQKLFTERKCLFPVWKQSVQQCTSFYNERWQRALLQPGCIA
jgi:hypothetical protein